MSGLMDVIKGAVNAAQAGAALAQKAVSQARQEQLVNDVKTAPRGEKGAALAVHLRQIEQTDGAAAAAEAFAALAAFDPALAAQAVAEFEQDKVDGGGIDARAPEGFAWEDVRDVYADPGAINDLIRQGNAMLGEGDPAAVDAYSTALADRLLRFGAANNTQLYANVASDIAASGSEALQRSFVVAGLQAADAWLGDSGDPFHGAGGELRLGLGPGGLAIADDRTRCLQLYPVA